MLYERQDVRVYSIWVIAFTLLSTVNKTNTAAVKNVTDMSYTSVT
jgi:hypothetical protein